MAYGFKVNGVDVQDKFVTYEDVDGVGGYKVFARGVDHIIPLTSFFPSVDGMTELSSLDNTKELSVSYYAGSVIKMDGTLWAWTSGFYGGAVGYYSNGNHILRKVNNDTDWAHVCTGIDDRYTGMSAAIKTDGTLWVTGSNSSGQLGLGDTVERSVYTQLGSANDWKKVVTNGTSTLAIKTNGSLWAWGNNTYGQLAQGDLTNRSVPTQINFPNYPTFVCEDVDIGSSYNVIAKTTDTDNNIFVWGKNGFGELARSRNPSGTPYRATIETVGSTFNPFNGSKIKTDGGCVFVITPNGTLYAWGINYKSSPVQVGSLTNWNKLCKSPALLAIKTDGTLWGTNNKLSPNGTSYLSPIQIGSKNDWVDAIENSTATFGLKNSI